MQKTEIERYLHELSLNLHTNHDAFQKILELMETNNQALEHVLNENHSLQFKMEMQQKLTNNRHLVEILRQNVLSKSHQLQSAVDALWMQFAAWWCGIDDTLRYVAQKRKEEELDEELEKEAVKHATPELAPPPPRLSPSSTSQWDVFASARRSDPYIR